LLLKVRWPKSQCWVQGQLNKAFKREQVQIIAICSQWNGGRFLVLQ
jgi:hypothetical protein